MEACQQEHRMSSNGRRVNYKENKIKTKPKKKKKTDLIISLTLRGRWKRQDFQVSLPPTLTNENDLKESEEQRGKTKYLIWDSECSTRCHRLILRVHWWRKLLIMTTLKRWRTNILFGDPMQLPGAKFLKLYCTVQSQKEKKKKGIGRECCNEQDYRQDRCGHQESPLRIFHQMKSLYCLARQQSEPWNSLQQVWEKYINKKMESKDLPEVALTILGPGLPAAGYWGTIINQLSSNPIICSLKVGLHQ